MVTRQLQVGRRTGKVRRPKTDVLPLSQRHQPSILLYYHDVVLPLCGERKINIIVNEREKQAVERCEVVSLSVEARMQ